MKKTKVLRTREKVQKTHSAYEFVNYNSNLLYKYTKDKDEINLCSIVDTSTYK